MPKASKRYREAEAARDRDKLYPLKDALAQVKSAPKAKFDETVDIAINLGVDPKHADQMVRGAIVLPNGVGRSTRVLVFAKGDKEAEARDAGADHVGGDELAKKIQDEGWFEFDRVIATPDMMGVVGRLGKVLGPKGLMPNPKLGTVTPNVEQAVKDAKSGQVEFRVEKQGIIHSGIGKLSFKDEDLKTNFKALTDAIVKAKPSGAKGKYVRKVTLTSSMGPGLKVDLAEVEGA